MNFTAKLLFLCAFSLAACAPPASKGATEQAHPSPSNPQSRELAALRQRLAQEQGLKLQIWQWPRDLNGLIPMTERVLKENNYGRRQIAPRAAVLQVLDVLIQQIDHAEPANAELQKQGFASTEVLLEFSGGNGRSLFTVRLNRGLKEGAASLLQYQMAGAAPSPVLQRSNFDALIAALESVR